MPPPDCDAESLKLVLDRLNHLEGILVGSLLGFFLTATAGGFAGAYTIRSDANRSLSLSQRQFFYGISVVYTFLSGYYYFMLAQFYGAAISAIELARSSSSEAVSVLWKTLQIPSFGFLPENFANLVMLLNAPLFPLMVSSALLYGFYILIRDTSAQKQTLGPLDLVTTLALQVMVCVLLAWHPFTRFLVAAELI
jgi:hypothetical protein